MNTSIIDLRTAIDSIDPRTPKDAGIDTARTCQVDRPGTRVAHRRGQPTLNGTR